MPQFSPSELKTARAPITVKPSGLSCQAELYLVSGGSKVATSGLKAFTSTAAAQDITFPITMPSTTGTYKVYLDIYAAGYLIAAYQAIEDVVIAALAEFAYVSAIRQIPFDTDPGMSWSMYAVRMEIDVKNVSSVAGVCKVQAQFRGYDQYGNLRDWADFGTLRPEWCLKQTTIQPGAIVTFFDSMTRSTKYYPSKAFPLRFIGDPGVSEEVNMI